MTNLTEQEKIDFLTHNLKLEENSIKKEFQFFLSNVIGLFTAPILPSLIFLAIEPPLFVNALMVGICALAFCTIPIGGLHLATYIRRLKSFKSLSNGKISYRQYKKLVKSGEIDKWQQQFKEEITAKKEEFLGIKTEEYKRDTENRYLVYKTLINKEGLSLDSEEFIKKVNELIQKNNKQNSDMEK